MKKGLVAAAFAALLIALLVIYLLPSPSTVPPPALPMPNAYLELVEVGRLVVNVPEDLDQADAETLRAFLDGNPDLIPVITEAIKHESLVPLEYSENAGAMAMKETSAIRQAARLLMAEARLAELEGRMADAAKANLNLIALSQRTSRGGLLLHFQVGVAYERAGWSSLLRIAPSLTAEERRDFLAKLESLQYQRESMDDFAERERTISVRTSGRWMTFIMSRQANQVVDACKVLDEQMKQMKQSVVEVMSQE